MTKAQNALQEVVTGIIQKNERSLSERGRRQLAHARDSMQKSCVGLAILGWPNHYQAADIIRRASGQIVGIDADCTCVCQHCTRGG